MFIRWRRLPHRQGRTWGLTAQLCRCDRVDGRPRSGVVAHLGALSPIWPGRGGPGMVDLPDGGQVERYALVAFWRNVDEKLGALGDCIDWPKIEAAILRTVPRL